MSKKDRQNSPSVRPQANNLGTALFIFVVLAGAILFLTGNLHFGPVAVLQAGGAIDDGHAHGADELMCAEHGVPESICVRCNPALAAAFKAKGDWCAGHNVPESQCSICNPGLGAASTGDPSDLEGVVCEHDMPIVECDNCRYEV
ncbi:MAG: hypothetical protein ABIF19_16940, partial [Planctomycetota bacterium]